MSVCTLYTATNSYFVLAKSPKLENLSLCAELST